MESKRRYSEKEISAILKIAAQHQASAGQDEVSANPGMTLAQIEEIASQVGIDPRHVQEAAEALDRGEDHDRSFHLWGAPLTIEFERIVEGEVTEENWSAVVEEIRSCLGIIGQANRVGASFEWTGGEMDLTHVTVTPRGGQTKIHIIGKVSGSAGLIYGLSASFGVSAAVILPVVMTGMLPVALAASAAIVGGTLLSTRHGFGALARKRERTLKNLLQRLESVVAEPIAQPAVQKESVLEQRKQLTPLESDAGQPHPQQTINH
jgi:hypothetical protein